MTPRRCGVQLQLASVIASRFCSTPVRASMEEQLCREGRRYSSPLLAAMLSTATVAPFVIVHVIVRRYYRFLSVRAQMCA
jgi:hypothetical protein